MGFSTALLALSSLQAVSQIGQGYVQKSEAKYNATLLEGKASLIDVQKGIENRQYERLKARTLSTSLSRTAGAGIKPTGSAMAVMLDTQKQINLDQITGQFNLDQKKRYTLYEAGSYRRSGKQAVKSGYMNAFSTMLSGGYRYGRSKNIFTPQGTVRDNTFDSVY
jgi:hypothetical protein